MMGIIHFAILCSIFALILTTTEKTVANNKLNQFQQINDSEALISAGGVFRLGFFSADNSRSRFLGIWFNNIPVQTIVWVANRDKPLNDSWGGLKIGEDGNLILVDRAGGVAWSTEIQNISLKPTVAQLLDSGNLVLRSANAERSGSYIWQSFDHPSNTQLAGMKLGWDLRIGLNRYLTSWKSADDPSPGEFSFSYDLDGLPQAVMRKGSVKQYRSGIWNGVQFNGAVVKNPLFNANFIANSDEMYFEFGLSEQLLMQVMNYAGTMQTVLWNNKDLEWIVISAYPANPCDNYGRCGPNAICTISGYVICSCLDGYVPKSLQDWNALFWDRGGCVRKHPLNCSEGEGFVALNGLIIPDLLRFWMSTSMTLKECELECLKNCSCTAYANSAATGGGCLIWYGDLIDIRTFADSGNQTLYIRVTAAELVSKSDSKKKKKLALVIIPISVALFSFFLASCIIWKRIKQTQGFQGNIPFKDDENINLPIFDIVTITEATNNFSISNKIGEGGFGPVYKGQLSTGQEIAVKRLSENSKQGLREFKNEVILIVKLQHRNLVRLLGCCIQGVERMLIYEYLPNGSLSSFIFDTTRSNSLAWRKRFDVIVGIARGLLYLHRDSRLRIIHRDLKASNVLLDNEMNPKISDFGIARAFGGDQISEKTRIVIGTYGYMSPEYILHGLFSMKSDVFSFGVLVLEIMSGQRNRKFRHPDHTLNLLGYAWKLWIEGKAIELVDEKLKTSTPTSEVIKSIQIGLLCVQKHPEDRPTMSSVLSMLDNESAMLPQPKRPGFYIESNNEIELASIVGQCASNEMTMSLLLGR